MRVAMLQIASPDDESLDDRIARVDALVRSEHALRDADLLVLPELWAVGGFHFDDYVKAAEPLDGRSVALARSWAAQHGLHVHTGSFVESGIDGLHNTSLLISPDGRTLATYRKVHLFGADEAREMTPGNELAVAEVDGITTALATCYDLRFPELFRSILDAGATMTVICSAWPQARADHWRLFTSARAVEEQMYVIACNSTGSQNGAPMAGASRIVDPWGVVVAEAGADEGFIYADIEADLPARTRARFPAVADRRWGIHAASS